VEVDGVALVTAIGDGDGDALSAAGLAGAGV
jgi:hypothetical protein